MPKPVFQFGYGWGALRNVAESRGRTKPMGTAKFQNVII
jgi:hypothetical protein